MTKVINTALAIKPAKTPRKQAVKAVKAVYEHQQGLVNQPKPLSTSTELSLVGLPAPHEATSMPVMPLELSSGNLMITRISLNKKATKLINAKPVTTTSKGSYTGKLYNRPLHEGACLTVWQWCDKNPSGTKKQAVAALDGVVNKITVQVQYGHYHRYYDKVAA
ncbi:MAG: hypothetical protein WC627_12030 [Legionella sp.]|jgi:hypothetical protein